MKILGDGEAGEGQGVSVGRNDRILCASRKASQLMQRGAVHLHHHDSLDTGASPGEHDGLAVRSPDRLHVGTGIVGQPCRVLTVGIRDVDVVVAARPVRAESEPRAIGRVGRVDVVGGAIDDNRDEDPIRRY